ncbi:MAG: hypothetical protein PHG39_11145 [Acidithiobacillus ferrooxidans]|nr:hypothetical protein [Acidithiobacillus ferrooxidans]MDD5004179.1 hypothetical protein [Acidithiobacillus sp.]MDD5380000.1 hypothetical protein [Acidithiobacillus sp.]
MNLESKLRGIKTLAYSSMTWRWNEAARDTVRRSCGEDGVIRHNSMPEVLQGNYQSCAEADIGAVQGGSSHCLHTLLAPVFS